MHWKVLSLVVLACAISSTAQLSKEAAAALQHGKVRLQAESGCRGCGGTPDSWVQKDTFAVGAKIWVRAVLTNQMKHNLLITTQQFGYGAGFFDFQAIDSQGKELRTAGSRCLQTCECHVAKDGTIHRFDELPPDPKAPPCLLLVTASSPPTLEIIKPGKSIEAFLEISADYQVPGPGEYRVNILRHDLWLLGPANLSSSCIVCEASSVKGARSLGSLEAKQLVIHVSPE